jgi:hypothetical protein
MLSDIISLAQLESTLGLYARSVTPSASGVTIALTPLRRIFGRERSAVPPELDDHRSGHPPQRSEIRLPLRPAREHSVDEQQVRPSTLVDVAVELHGARFEIAGSL